MDLYFSPLACSMATRIALYEAGADIRYIYRDRAKRLPDGSDFLQINPLGMVPTLRTDFGDVMTENAYILRYVGERRTREDARFLAVVFERLQIEITLVAERRIEARPVHAGRLGQVVERGSGIARLPERIGGARERLRGIVGARPPAPFRLTRLFLYHFANNP